MAEEPSEEPVLWWDTNTAGLEIIPLLPFKASVVRSVVSNAELERLAWLDVKADRSVDEACVSELLL